jgi:hypothetical protein
MYIFTFRRDICSLERLKASPGVHCNFRSQKQVKEIYSQRGLVPDPDSGLYPDPVRAKIMKKHVKLGAA